MRHSPTPPRHAQLRAGHAAAWVTAVGLALLAAWLIVSGAPAAHAAGSAQVQQQLSTSRQQVTALSGDLAAAQGRVTQLTSGITSLSSRLAGIQADLNAKRAQLLRLRAQLTAAQGRLSQLQSVVSVDQRALARQLVGGYEGARPDIIDVVLEATGFNDLLERLDFAQRTGRQDTRIPGSVKAARSAVSAEAIRLGVLSARQNRLAEQALAERNQAALVKLHLVAQRLAAARTAAAKANALAGAQSRVSSLATQLAQLQATTGTQPGARSPAPSHAPVAHGFEFPMPKADVSPPATWSLDDGVDIAAPGGTPELAVCSGTIVQHGIGGFGPSAPVLHCDSPLAGYDYVYYGHAGPGNWTPVGTHVSQGQVISEVGYGIVGISSGPHLELGFADSSGAPVGPSSAPAMMALLRASY